MYRRVYLTLALCCGLMRPAAADKLLSAKPIQNGIGIEIGGITSVGMSEYGADGLAPSAQGVLIRDRNGMTSRMVIGLLIAVAGAMAASGPKSVESHREGNYIVTTTTYYSEAEKAQMRENNSKAVEGLFKARYADFEMHLYSRDLFKRGETSGYKINFFVGGGSETFGFETGFGFGKANSRDVDEVTLGEATIHWKYLGMPFRLTKVKGPLRFALTFEWNWLKYGVEDTERVRTPEMDAMGNPTNRSKVTAVSHPFHFDVSTTILTRIALTAGVTAQSKAPLGLYLSAGLFF